MNKMEHITVVYFNPTSGTRKACPSLAMEMGKKAKDVDLCSLEGGYSFGSEDTVIAGVLVFGGRVPGYAAEKLTYLKGGGAAAVTAAVYGNRAFEDALLELDDYLKTQGFRTGAGTALLVEHPMIRGVMASRPDGKDQKEMVDFVAEISEKLGGDGRQEPQVPGNCPYRDWKQMPVIPLTNASCISCGLCAARCPVQAIPVGNPSSTDQSRCTLCVRCISVCPMKARSLSEQACAMLKRKLPSVRDIRRENELLL